MGCVLHVHHDRSHDAATVLAMTLRIERSTRRGFTVFTLSGRIEAEQVAELKELSDTDCRNIILDLQE
jgi:hypothetical protein